MFRIGNYFCKSVNSQSTSRPFNHLKRIRCSSATDALTNKIVSAISKVSDQKNIVSDSEIKSVASTLSKQNLDFVIKALVDVSSHKTREEFESQLAASKWTSRFGRPSKVSYPVDSTAALNRPHNKVLMLLFFTNCIPFIGFGFLDNFIMIVAGDYIDHVLGSYICLSTMAAAALGNTLSDVAGIGSAWYVEKFAEYLGFSPPHLNQVQSQLPVTKRCVNGGRVFGIIVGCFLGMLPLLFMDGEPAKKAETSPKQNSEQSTESEKKES